MKNEHVKIMENFTLENIPDLDVCTLASLEMFSHSRLPKINFNSCKRPLVVGSGNAAVTGKIIFADLDAIFANESSLSEKLKNIKPIDGVFLLSASGSKHSIEIAKKAKAAKKQCWLLTCNPHAPAGKFMSRKNIFVFPKNREPYTYNTSTYMGMILAKTKESPKKIKNFIEKKVRPAIPSDISSYSGYYLMLPEQFDCMKEMFTIKFVELFGRRIARDIFTSEQSRHATSVVPADELFIHFGKSDVDLGKKITIPLPPKAGYAAMMAIGYYVIGRIQAGKPPWFKQNLEEYCRKSSKLFGQDILPVVE